MHIHQSGAHGQSCRIDDLSARLIDVAADDSHLSVFHQDIHDTADAPHRVHQASLTNQQFHWITPFRSAGRLCGRNPHLHSKKGYRSFPRPLLQAALFFALHYNLNRIF